ESSAFNRSFGSPALRALLVVFVLTATVFSALPLLRYLRGHTIFDYELWYTTGRHVLAGDEIYFFRAGKYDFMYPPPCALFLAGASLLGQGGLIFLLVPINCLAWFCSAKLSAILAAGNRGPTSPWLYLIPSLLVIVYIWSSYHLGQPNLVLLALMLGAFVALRAGRQIVGGGLIAVAAAIKAFPVLNTLIISIALGLGIVFIVVIPRDRMRTVESNSFEFALLLLLMLMVTPLSFGYFYSWLLLPFAVIAQRVLAGKSAAVLWWALPALMLLALGIPFPRAVQLYGNTFFATLFLFIGLSVQLLCFKQQAAQAQTAADLHSPH